MTDRRRINGPAGTTSPPVFAACTHTSQALPRRVRKPNELRKIFLQTGLVSAASGSAYLELESPPRLKRALLATSPTIKLSCSVLGPKPLPRTASFSPNLQLTASVKFAPFATRNRRGYVRDSTEKDLGMHLENALKGAIIPDRWPKSAIDVSVTVLEGEDDPETGERGTGVGFFNMLAGCINVAVAALADARVDCLDLLAAGVCAVVPGPGLKPLMILDPACAEHQDVLASCLIGYLPSRDEVVEIWTTGSALVQNGDGGLGFEELMDGATAAARGAQIVLKEVLLESMMPRRPSTKMKQHEDMIDVEMGT